ncbi:lytic transglycosylase domain-containing protein [Desulfomicrobium orale]|uniref:Transglycosylase SLT domain-containing protein n=1 Tax=Desulfomicrobium orale DSM 12838 TaxID=888061 RepID=A0A109W6B9_9BACT|nr:lytic transglycosylase domain-containing protein [Desulfomicrobium orale]AMD93393.1 hypothetical protein AXF15_09980 [Desulfomicrobium orale DSM 12838]
MIVAIPSTAGHAVIFFLLSLSSVAQAAEVDLFAAPCEKYKVSSRLARAIAKTESNLHPWAVNVAGRAYYPDSAEAALRIIADAKEKGLSHDIGLMQINSRWLTQLGISPETALVPANNVTLGVYILALEIRRHGYNWKAVGAYHSPTPARQMAYARKVNTIYQQYRRLTVARY